MLSATLGALKMCKTDSQDTKSIDSLIVENIGEARKIANAMTQRLACPADREDAISSAMTGLVEAANAYDHSLEVPFMGFASRRIRGAVLDGMRKGDRLNRRQREGVTLLRRLLSDMRMELGREPHGDELEDKWIPIPGVPTAQIARELSAVYEHDIEDERGVSAGMLDSPAQMLSNRQVGASIASAIMALPEKQRFVVFAYYVRGFFMREIGFALGCTESRVSQLHKSAMKSLRHTLNTDRCSS